MSVKLRGGYGAFDKRLKMQLFQWFWTRDEKYGVVIVRMRDMIHDRTKKGQ